MEEQVVLVDEQNNELGFMGKQEAHEKGLLHRAISIIVFNKKNEMLVQQRAFTKYHWAGIWSNTCCSHPRAGETFAAAAHRRLQEELGFETPLEKQFSFIYKAHDAQSGLTEHELDEVFVGYYDGEMKLNPEEVEAVKWMSTSEVFAAIEKNPDDFSFWFKIILQEMKQRNALPA